MVYFSFVNSLSAHSLPTPDLYAGHQKYKLQPPNLMKFLWFQMCTVALAAVESKQRTSLWHFYLSRRDVFTLEGIWFPPLFLNRGRWKSQSLAGKHYTHHFILEWRWKRVWIPVFIPDPLWSRGHSSPLNAASESSGGFSDDQQEIQSLTDISN